MTAVAVWSERPTPEALLSARLRAGWRPTPSELQDGERILGFAERFAEFLGDAQ